jgi:hypothetical protein
LPTATGKTSGRRHERVTVPERESHTRLAARPSVSGQRQDPSVTRGVSVQRPDNGRLSMLKMTSLLTNQTSAFRGIPWPLEMFRRRDGLLAPRGQQELPDLGGCDSDQESQNGRRERAGKPHTEALRNSWCVVSEQEGSEISKVAPPDHPAVHARGLNIGMLDSLGREPVTELAIQVDETVVPSASDPKQA